MTEPKKFNKDDRFLTAKEVIEILNISKTTFYARLKDPDFPQPYKFGARCNRWPQSAWDDYLRRLS